MSDSIGRKPIPQGRRRSYIRFAHVRNVSESDIKLYIKSPFWRVQNDHQVDIPSELEDSLEHIVFFSQMYNPYFYINQY